MASAGINKNESPSPEPVTVDRSQTAPSPADLPREFGRYQIIRKLGKGGMGSVYLGHDTQLDRPVALKVPHFSAADGPQLLERFYREARAAAGLHHPNLCPVYDSGCINGIPFLTMAYIEGTTLAQHFSSDRPMAPRQAAGLVCKLARALHEAHQHGIVHRDLKPANIMIDRRGEPVVMDFGLARRDHPQELRLTQTGAILGTPAYMAPEQIQGDSAVSGGRCDIYSLGVILYELVTGRLPFTGSRMAVLSQVLTKDPPAPTTHRPNLDPALVAIIQKAMARNPAQRYPTMAALAADLAKFAGRNSPKAPTATVAPKVPDSLPPTAPLPVRPAGKRRRLALAGSAVAVVALLGVVVYFVTDTGTIHIELSDQKAAVEIKVDGKTMPAGPSWRLPARDHELLITGKDYETVRQTFTVRRGENPPLKIDLVPRADANTEDNDEGGGNTAGGGSGKGSGGFIGGGKGGGTTLK